LIAARTLTREEIAMVYDVPPPMIGDLTHGTYSNVQELHSMLYVTTLRPWLKLIEETLQAQLIDPEPAWRDDGIFLEFDLSEVLRGSPKEQLDALSVAFGAGLITLNEARKELNLPRLADPSADKPFIPTNNQTPLDGGARVRAVPRRCSPSALHRRSRR
jgi:HK97 family phage portal protein